MHPSSPSVGCNAFQKALIQSSDPYNINALTTQTHADCQTIRPFIVFTWKHFYVEKHYRGFVFLRDLFSLLLKQKKTHNCWIRESSFGTSRLVTTPPLVKIQNYLPQDAKSPGF